LYNSEKKTKWKFTYLWNVWYLWWCMMKILKSKIIFIIGWCNLESLLRKNVIQILCNLKTLLDYSERNFWVLNCIIQKKKMKIYIFNLGMMKYGGGGRNV